MCGIAGLVLKKEVSVNLPQKLKLMSQILKHRGPDGEGFILARTDTVQSYFDSIPLHGKTHLAYLPKLVLPAQDENAVLGFTHRRLSIIDLSETGHQPMCNSAQNLWITYNGEIYNYIELREELKNKGHQFVSESDTEVILAAYSEWGTSCVEKFNGMWSFCIYDKEKQICFASRDRFGVKPFYYVNETGYFAFASEQKALVKAGLVKANMDGLALHNYLVNGLLENESANFFEGILELWPGTNLTIDLKTFKLNTTCYYHLSHHITLENEQLNEKELISKISETFQNAIRLRLRSDVEVGTCLSGGIDSSAIAVSISGIRNQALACFTSVFRNATINEEHFADLVAYKIGAKHYKIEPDLNGFMKEIEMLVYSQDVPIWDTSTYAQFKVMELAGQNRIKVVLDGQGADELFGGYHHHFLAKWNNLFSTGNIRAGLREIHSSEKSINKPFQFYLKEKLKQKRYFQKKHFSLFLNADFIAGNPLKNPSVYFDELNQQLVHDIYQTRLKSFLKCEDRCGMWHSVESRTPFSDDVDLINLLFSFNGNKKIKGGVSKYLLREAVKNQLPQEIYQRHDKKGFETPMNDWIIKMRPLMLEEIRSAGFDFVNTKGLEKTQEKHIFQNKLLFKLFVLSKWKKVFQV